MAAENGRDAATNLNFDFAEIRLTRRTTSSPQTHSTRYSKVIRGHWHGRRDKERLVAYDTYCESACMFMCYRSRNTLMQSDSCMRSKVCKHPNGVRLNRSTNSFAETSNVRAAIHLYSAMPYDRAQWQ